MALDRGSLLLRKQLAELVKGGSEGFSAGLIDDDDVYKWEVVIYGPPDTLYEGGYFKAHLNFPKEYPNRPPKMKFVSDMWHPNIDQEGNVCISILHKPGDDTYGHEQASERWLNVMCVCVISVDQEGNVCISILHEPGDDKYGYEQASERWLPIHTVETILVSVISMLADPNDESPANVDAAKMWRAQADDFKKRVARCVRKSQDEFL
ncbi:hypothetical protein V1264_022667 [Littorina saxatilis]|uniref:UBC core domain-containing protein n=1 Tax=Littorina saxatilis TaxID=31220 RepID=A0AAN9AKV8_9CAEN